MRNVNLLAVVILLPFITFAQIKQVKNFTVQVRIANAKKDMQLFLAYQNEGKKILDSVVEKNGFFILSGMVDRPLTASLVADHNGLGIEELIKRSKKGEEGDILKFYIHPGTINIKTDVLIKNATFSGSRINADNERLKMMLRTIEDQQTSLSNQLRSGNYLSSPNGKQSSRKPLSSNDSLKVHKLLEQLDSLDGARKSILKKFIHANPGSYISLMALWKYGGGFPDLPVIEPMYNRLAASVRNTISGKEYHKFLSDQKNMVVGTKAPDFTLNDAAGNPISLRSFRGQYVLIDFWASWCGPCRAGNPALVQIFHDYKDKNFTILGISLDAADGKKAWLKAIKDDNISWTQVSDLKKWENHVSKLYSIHAIPQNFLIDPNGFIIAKGLNHKELRTKLEEILSK